MLETPKILECSTKGHKRFSAFYARLEDGRSIEEHYQCDVKGYDVGGKNWKFGKGKPPLDESIDSVAEYDKLWRRWLRLNPDLKNFLTDLKGRGCVFEDCFSHGRTPNQADSLYRLCDETLIINLLGGPGSGKSTTAALLFGKLKNAGVNCELATEFAKDLTWSHRQKDLAVQAYVFGKQYHKIHRLVGEVDIIVTDSPFILSNIYVPKEYPPSFKKMVWDMWMRDNNLNFFLNRKKSYSPKGRNQTESEAKEIDNSVKNLLDSGNVSYYSVDADLAVKEIYARLEERNYIV